MPVIKVRDGATVLGAVRDIETGMPHSQHVSDTLQPVHATTRLIDAAVRFRLLPQKELP
jgi:hypothetical protein